MDLYGDESQDIYMHAMGLVGDEDFNNNGLNMQ
mgnify:FL=1